MQFQQEFPSLTSSGEHKNVITTNAPQANADQRPSLRPQSNNIIHFFFIFDLKTINCLAETSWMQGGSRPQIPQGVGNVTGVSGQIVLHSQTLTGM